MEKHFITALLVVILLAPQTGLEAKSRYYYSKDRGHNAEERDHEKKKSDYSHRYNRYKKSKKRHHKADKKHRHLRAIKAKLKSLKRAVSEINTKMADLESQGAQIPTELVDKLDALQMAVDTNQKTNQEAMYANYNAIGDILAKIESINMGISDLDTRLFALEGSDLDMRLSALEQADPTGSGPAESDLVFSGNFINGSRGGPRFGIKFDWLAFRNNATGSFTSIEISNDLGGRVVCATLGDVKDIVDEFNSHEPRPGSEKSFTCMDPNSGIDVTWTVGPCSGEVELNASSRGAEVCALKTGAVVRPLMTNSRWGGIGTDFGGAGNNSNPLSQELKVILTR